MKKILVILMCLLTLCACSKPDSGTMVIEEGDEPEILVGGWYVNPELPAINDAYFDAATKDITGVGYTPLLELGTQVVAGRNIAYLAYGTVVTPDASSSFKIVKIYVDLQDKAEITDVKDFVVEQYLNDNASPSESLLGGFSVNEELPNLLDEKTNDVFNKAIEGLVGVGYEPICLLATQVVAGTNYAFLAKGTTVTATPQTNLYVVKVYESLDSNVELTNICAIELS